jgi:hypothetical protein
MTKANRIMNIFVVIALTLTSIVGVKAQTLIAHYPFNNTLAPSVGAFGSAVAGTGTTIGSTSICTDNVNSYAYGLSTPSISTLSVTSFQIDFTINLTSLPTVHNASIFVIGGGSRYFGLCLNQSGELKVFCNLGTVFSDASSGFTLTTGTNYDIQLQYINGTTTLIVNNQSFLSVMLPVLMPAEDPYDLDRSIFLGDNPGFASSTWIQGCYSNLKVYNNPTPYCKTWTGATSTDWATASNWSPAVVPSGDNVLIPSSGIVNFPIASNITINSGKILNLQSGARLTVTGVLTNNGMLSIENGATLVQGSTSTYVGSGSETVNVKQVINGGRSSTTGLLTGRFWYLGSPVTGANSSVFFRTSRDLVTSSYNLLKQRDEPTNAWNTIAIGANVSLAVGKGYYLRASNGNATTSSAGTSLLLTFNGGGLNNHPTSNALTLNLSRNVNAFAGFNLVCNPYPSYLDWDLVGKNQVENTMWYRTATGTSSASMVFETYVSGAAGGIGTNLSGNTATKLIPPMQAFWVRVSSGNTSGTITMDNSMRSHFTSFGGSTAGLRSTNDELKMFLRMNLLQGENKDQLIVYMNNAATNGFDILDGEKMMQASLPQFYTKAGDKNIVINGLNAAKKQQSLPVTMELPATGVHTFEIENLELETGLVWLEDTQEGTMEALTEGYTYQFYGEAGINSDRFVLHFNILDNTTPSAPNYGEVNNSANFSGKGASVHAESAGVVVIKLPATTEGITDIQIRDAAGRLIYTGSTNALETSVQLAQANGIYYVTLNSASGVEVRKVFIQQ